MDIRRHLDKWERRLTQTLDWFETSGAEIEGVFRAGKPGEYLLRDAVRDVKRPLPALFDELFNEEVALRGGWRLPEHLDVSLPAATSEVMWGGLDLSVKGLVAAETSRLGWVEECFPNRNDPYDAVWHDKFAFHFVANGDCLAVADGDGNGPVYYLSHDDGEGHGARLAPSFLEFMDRWSRLAFAGPEDWLLLPFLGARDGLEPEGETAQAWRRAAGLPPQEAG